MVVEEANIVANEYIESEMKRVLHRVAMAQKYGGGRRTNGKLVKDINERIDQAEAGRFDCLHYSLDECGNIISPDVPLQRRKHE